MEIFSANFLETNRFSLMNSGDLYKMLHCKDYMEIFSANFLETKRLSLMNSGDLYKMLHCKHYMMILARTPFELHTYRQQINAQFHVVLTMAHI